LRPTFLIMLLPIIAFANPIHETTSAILLIKLKGLGDIIYQQCILTPPSPQQAIACGNLYSDYNNYEMEITLPNPVIKSLDESPYASSSYDICRNETGHVIFSENIPGHPYCTIVPI
jgi:hypothetical protein